MPGKTHLTRRELLGLAALGLLGGGLGAARAAGPEGEVPALG